MSETYRGKRLARFSRSSGTVKNARALLISSPHGLPAALVATSLILLTASLVLQYARFHLEDTLPGQRALTFAFNVNREVNVPTLFSALQLLLCGLLAREVSLAPRVDSPPGEARMWGILGLVFFAMGVEEAVSARSLVTYSIGRFFESGGIFGGVLHFSWVVPGLAVVVIFGAFFGSFVLRLPPRTRNLMLASGAIYLSGALGMEMISGFWIEFSGRNSFFYSLLTTVEEAFEMLAVSVVAFTVLDLLRRPEG